MAPLPDLTDVPGPLVAATEALFVAIAETGDPHLKDAVRLINSRRRVIRNVEARLITDGDDELAALKACWARRDIPELKTLIAAYYRRRQALASQVVAVLNDEGQPRCAEP